MSHTDIGIVMLIILGFMYYAFLLNECIDINQRVDQILKEIKNWEQVKEEE